MKYYLKREQDQYFLVVHDLKEKSEMTSRMILENEIPGFLSCQKKSLDGEELWFYCRTGYQSLQECEKENPLSGHMLKSLLSGLYAVLEVCSPYFLEPEEVCLNPDFIFFNNNQWKFIYLPEKTEESMEEKIKKFSETILEVINHEDEQAVVMGYQFHKRIVRMKNSETISDILLHFIAQENKEVYEDKKSDEEIYNKQLEYNEIEIQSEEQKNIIESGKENKEKDHTENIGNEKVNIKVYLYLFLIISSLLFLVYLFWWKRMNFYSILSFTQAKVSFVCLGIGMVGLLFTLFKGKKVLCHRLENGGEVELKIRKEKKVKKAKIEKPKKTEKAEKEELLPQKFVI